MNKIQSILVVIGVIIFLLLISNAPSSDRYVPSPSEPNPIVGNSDGLDANSGNTLPKSAQDTFSVKEDDTFYGSRDAKYIIFEYSDFQCPFCQRFHPTLENLVDNSNGQIAWVYRHLPLISIHPLAKQTAVISECVREKVSNDAFWKFANDIFSVSNLIQSDITRIAISNGLSEAQITSCQKQQSTANNKVRRNEDESRRFAFNGTPNGIVLRLDNMRFHTIPGAIDSTTLKSLIDSL